MKTFSDERFTQERKEKEERKWLRRRGDNNGNRRFQKQERCRQAGSFIISSPGLMHRPQSRDARTYVTGFHKRWHILSRATPAMRWSRYVCKRCDKITGNDRWQEENICHGTIFFAHLLSSVSQLFLGIFNPFCETLFRFFYLLFTLK